jgi:cytochrome d ubiquinol oxidase subunit II
VNGSASYIATLWTGVADAAILGYLLMDGWVIGLGILYPLVARRTDRDRLLQSMPPFRSTNGTWLAFGVMLLLLASPTALSLSLARLYWPTLALLFSLVLRSIGYELRWRITVIRPLSGLAFAAGSILAALAQGYLVGRLIEAAGGHPVASGLTGWRRGLLPLSCSLALLGGYGFLGARWLVDETTDALQVMGREVSRSTLVLASVFAIIAISLSAYTAPYQYAIHHLGNDPAPLRFSGAQLYAALPVMALYALLGYWTVRGRAPRADPSRAPDPTIASRKTCGHDVDLHLS